MLKKLFYFISFSIIFFSIYLFLLSSTLLNFQKNNTLMVHAAPSNNYYVDKDSIGGTCDDSSGNNGSITEPYCTIEYALNQLPNDRVSYGLNIREGTYEPTGNYFQIKYGSSDSNDPFVIAAYADESVVLTVPADAADVDPGDPQVTQSVFEFSCWGCVDTCVTHNIDNITIENLTFSGSTGLKVDNQGNDVTENYIRFHGGQYSSPCESTYRFWFDNIRINDNLFKGTATNTNTFPTSYGDRAKGVAITAGNPNADNFVIQDNEIYWLSTGIRVSGDDHQVLNNNIHDIDRLNTVSTGSDKNGGACLVIGPGNNMLIKNNIFMRCFAGYTGGALTNELDGSAVEFSGSSSNWIEDVIIEKNYFEKNKNILESVQARNVIFRNNISVDENKMFMLHNYADWGGNGLYEIYNNTFVDMQTSSYTDRGELMSIRSEDPSCSYCSRFTFRNNIVTINGMATEPGYETVSILLTSLTEISDYSQVNITNNLYKFPDSATSNRILKDNTSTVHKTIVSANTIGMETDSQVDDPDFVAADDFHLLETSSAIDTGFDFSGIITDDYDDVVRPQGSEYDIGAYEYVSATSTPTPTATNTPVPTNTPTPTPTATNTPVPTNTPTPTSNSYDYSIDSPDSYSDNGKPDLKFYLGSDITGISNFKIKLDESKDEHYSVTIPASISTSDDKYEHRDDSDYEIIYYNLEDGNDNNNLVSIFFKELNDNDLDEGKHKWEVIAKDSNDDEVDSKSKNFYIDLSSPSISDLAIANLNHVSYNSTYYLDSLSSISLSGMISDPFNSEGDLQETSSEPKKINVTIDKFLNTYQYHDQFDYYVQDVYEKSTDYTYERFYFSFPEELDRGKYRITLTAYDKVGNEQVYDSFYIASIDQDESNDSSIAYSSTTTESVSPTINPSVEENKNEESLSSKIPLTPIITTPDQKKVSSVEEKNAIAFSILIVDKNQQPVKDAKVTLHSSVKMAYTNNSGIAKFDDVILGDHNLSVEKGQYKFSKTIDITQGWANQTIDIQIEQEITKNHFVWLGVGMLTMLAIGTAVLSIRKKRHALAT